ncbi:hypothetical protein Pst134EA_031280 [Puccinia striiformis f. sp. tritici]|uniref:uncharacterized protein n=1 Tax=Puccinia striiformis f. sp. tritici TaxID=168172 RepID=UPI0020079316|nr:uncharacterized protein Pst134EA_031280 [Puccinia striiformis f. sp. tritici]KAH9443404.1 hypothetical protein Pst134EA_031280 [Puccinia striiformis f. sp. tritici]
MNLYIILILLAVGSDHSLGAVSETSREISSRVVSDGPCMHEPSSNQIDRDIINPLESDGQRLSSTASASRAHPSTRLEDPQTLQVVIEHPEEKPSNEASSKVIQLNSNNSLRVLSIPKGSNLVIIK